MRLLFSVGANTSIAVRGSCAQDSLHQSCSSELVNVVQEQQMHNLRGTYLR